MNLSSTVLQVLFFEMMKFWLLIPSEWQVLISVMGRSFFLATELLQPAVLKLRKGLLPSAQEHENVIFLQQFLPREQGTDPTPSQPLWSQFRGVELCHWGVHGEHRGNSL
jgi:hypothetical protein